MNSKILQQISYKSQFILAFNIIKLTKRKVIGQDTGNYHIASLQLFLITYY